MAKMRAGPRAPTRPELLAALRYLMPLESYEDAVRALDQYPGEAWRSRTREDPATVQMAALGLSGATLEGLRRHITIARADYRDLLAGASTKPWAAEYRAVQIRLGEAGLSPWAEWLSAEPPGDSV